MRSEGKPARRVVNKRPVQARSVAGSVSLALKSGQARSEQARGVPVTLARLKFLDDHQPTRRDP